MSYDSKARRDTPLALKLKQRIQRDGPIPVSAYMAACLYDAEHGYYRWRNAIGRDGDFITAPEISQIFGELIGLWCAVAWQQMGSPPRFNLVEIGPGRGTLMQDMLRATRNVPGFLGAARVILHETSAALAAEQRRTLRGGPVPIAWVETPELLGDARVPEAPVILIANELLDCEPRDQLVRVSDRWLLREIGLDDDGNLAFRISDTAEGRAAFLTGQAYLHGIEAPDGSIFEPTARHWVQDIIENAPQAAALMLDYGHAAPALGDTLQAVRLQRYEHPLTSPGEADLTMQVDFAAHCKLLGAPPSRLLVDGPVTQAEFLGSLGIIERASRLMAANPARAGEIEIAVARLLAPNGMGGRFKAIGIRSAAVPPLPGFPGLDASHPMR